MEKEKNYKFTLASCFFGYVSQAILVNLPPLLFVVFATGFGLSLDKIALLVIVGFITQLVVDLAASKFAVKIGYRICSVTAHIFVTVGLIMLGFLPFVMSPFVGLVIAFLIMNMGGGLIEVLVSPIVDALPAKSKSGAMSLLHSFYCWGQVAVVLFTTLIFLTPLKNYWQFIPAIWAIIPLCGMFMFMFAPFPPREEEAKAPYKKLFTKGIFWVFLILMILAGAAEQSISQWASLFAEMGLKVSKTVGNLLGACCFAALMGIARVIFGVFGSKMNMRLVLAGSGVITVLAYCMVVFVPVPIVNLIGCALAGLGVGLAWPGVLSLASGKMPFGGTAMFALLAMGGDIGCAIGPGLVGLVSDAVNGSGASWLGGLFGSGDVVGLKSGLMIALIFPILFIVFVLMIKNKPKKGAPLYKEIQ